MRSPFSVSVTVMDIAHVGLDVGVVMVFVRVRVGHGCRGEAQQDSSCCWIPRPHVITIRSSRSGPGCVSGH